MTTDLDKSPCLLNIEDVPDEVLEFILGFVPPYKDLHDCMAVCKRWKRCVQNVVKTKKRNLHRALSEFEIAWSAVLPSNGDHGPTITERYSHSATVCNNYMYVFGGRTTTMTTFNDLWRLELSTRRWVRPITTGEYPSPKACCTMVCHKDLLILFGGWTYPPSYPVHQACHLFNELHTYSITTNRWSCVISIVAPPPSAGHSATVHRNQMIVFGGLQRPSHLVHSTKSNDLWILDLHTWNWTKKETVGKQKPLERYGQSQAYLDEDNLLILGGCGGQTSYYTDVWRLNMSGNVWRWFPVEIKNEADAPGNLWCNPACKIDDKIIVFSRSRPSKTPSFTYYYKGMWMPFRQNVEEGVVGGGVAAGIQECTTSKRIDLAQRQVDRDDNVNGKRGTLKGVKRNNPEGVGDGGGVQQAGPSGTVRGVEKMVVEERLGKVAVTDEQQQQQQGSSGQDNLLPPAKSNPNSRPSTAASRTEQRLATIRRAEENWKKQHRTNNSPQILQPPIAEKENNNNGTVHEAYEVKKRSRRIALGMYVLDITHVLETEGAAYVEWLPLKHDGLLTEGPEERVLYSLVEGKSELIMFGGIQKDPMSLLTATNNHISNSLHFITAPSYVI